MSYTVIGHLRSRTLRVLWMLEEIGEPYMHIPAASHGPEIQAVNPAGKIPALVVDGNAITDSTAILTYLGDRHGKLCFPAGTIERAQQDSLTQFLLDEFDSVLWTATRYTHYLPEERRDLSIRDSLMWEFERSQRTLARRMGDGPFLMGEAMTISDIICAHCGSWAQGAGFPITDPKVADYMARLNNRPHRKMLLRRAAQAT